MPWNFDEFIRERKFLHNVSPRTIEWYEQTFNWLRKYEPTEPGVKEFVIGMREGGLKAISCNSRIRVANAYFKWAGLLLHINRLKEEHRVLPTFTTEQLARLITFKASTFYQKRLHALVMTLFDSGLRIEEALGLRRSHCVFRRCRSLSPI